MKQYQFTIPLSLHNQRIDKALTGLLQDASRSSVQKYIKANNVSLNNQIISDSKILIKENDIVTIIITPEEISKIESTDIKLNIIYEDDDLIIINKQANLSVHPGVGNYQNTLVNALMHHTTTLSNNSGLTRPGIVHRLDKDTTGLMVVAKNNIIHEKLAKKIQDRSLVRKYKALAWGMPNPSSGAIETNIVRSRKDRTKMTVTKIGGKDAITYYQTDQIYYGGKISLLTCKLETGRTHQIRVHLSHIGHSIVGDQTYGHNSRKITALPLDLQGLFTNFKRQALHSYYMSFMHPVSHELLEFEAELPGDMQALLN